MRFQLEIGILLALLSTTFAEAPFSAEESGKYDVFIIKDKGEDTYYYKWAGVIINHRYVLSTYTYKSKEDWILRQMKIIIGYFANQYMSIIENGKEIKKYSNDRYMRYEALKLWMFESLTLIKTKIRIRLEDKMRFIQLPNKPEHAAWKNPCNIPNKVEFTTTSWFERKKNKKYTLHVIKNKRKCLEQDCSSQRFIHSCFSVRVSSNPVEFPAGGPLVYNNTLVGIRREAARIEPPTTVFETDFINVAHFVNMIEEVMNGGVQCYP